MFLDFEGATDLQTFIVSSVSGLRGSPRPSNPYSFVYFWTFRLELAFKPLIVSSVSGLRGPPQAIKPLWFQVSLVFEGATGNQTIIVSSVSGL